MQQAPNNKLQQESWNVLTRPKVKYIIGRAFHTKKGIILKHHNEMLMQQITALSSQGESTVSLSNKQAFRVLSMEEMLVVGGGEVRSNGAFEFHPNNTSRVL